MFTIKKIKKTKIEGIIKLPLSKSIVNRLLIINALKKNKKMPIENIQSTDNILLEKAIYSRLDTINFEDAGTPLRFYLAFACFNNIQSIITGNNRLIERPIEPLINSLKQLGVEFEFLEKENFLPLRIKKGINKNISNIIIDGTLSSQFVSAVMLIAPYLNNGLNIEIIGNSSSKKYIETTIQIMKQHGAKITKTTTGYIVSATTYQTLKNLKIESDWSAASFIYNMAAMVNKTNILMPNLFLKSSQGDKYTATLYKKFGVISKQQTNGIQLSKTFLEKKSITINFSNIPDMFPAVVACCAALKIKGKFTGLINLTLKESNRIIAMQENIHQTGALLKLIDENNAQLIYFESQNEANFYHFKTFNDHRIAMACSIFAFQKNITFDNENVINKSFKNYWEIFKDLTH